MENKEAMLANLCMFHVLPCPAWLLQGLWLVRPWEDNMDTRVSTESLFVTVFPKPKHSVHKKRGRAKLVELRKLIPLMGVAWYTYSDTKRCTQVEGKQ